MSSGRTEAPGALVEDYTSPVGSVTTTSLAAVARRLTDERLARYRTAASGDLDRALRLYEWDVRLSAAFWVILAHAEVVVRNAMHEQLTRWSAERHGEPRWYLDPGGVLTPGTQALIADARARLRRYGRPETPGRVVAELHLGFWRFLLSAPYERVLWRTCLWRAFPGNGRRRDVHDAMTELHVLRNRIAHHEPIYHRPLWTVHETALTLAGWICPDTRRWIARQSSVRTLLGAKP